MVDNGWIKLHRKISEKGYYKKSQYVHLWIHLLIKANHKTKEFMWNNEIVMVQEGQFITGRKQLSKETGISETSIERILTLFENEHQIGQQKTNKYRLITIKNWVSHQIEKTSGHQSGQQADNKRTTSGQQADTNKNDKNEKEGEEGKTPLSSFDYPEDFMKFYNDYDYEGDIVQCYRAWQGIDILNQSLILKRLYMYLNETTTDINGKLRYRMRPEKYLLQEVWKRKQYLPYEKPKETDLERQVREAFGK